MNNVSIINIDTDGILRDQIFNTMGRSYFHRDLTRLIATPVFRSLVVF